MTRNITLKIQLKFCGSSRSQALIFMHLSAVLNSIVRITFQLCGRAGRSGLSAKAHILLLSAKVQGPQASTILFWH